MLEATKSSRGFTLVELLIALAIAGFALTMIVAYFIAQSQTYAIYNLGVDLQRTMRINMTRMEREIRMVGYNPGGLDRVEAESDGIDNDCDGTIDETDDPLTPMIDESETIGILSALPTTVRYTADLNGDGLACGDREQVVYTLNVTTLERNGLPLQSGIDAFDLVYLDQNNSPASSIEEIRAIQIAIVGRARSADPGYHNTKAYVNLRGDQILAPQNDKFHRRMLATQVHGRNLTD